MATKAIIFDAYGTVFDVQGTMKPVFEQVFGTKHGWVQALWRMKYHECLLIRTCAGR